MKQFLTRVVFLLRKGKFMKTVPSLRGVVYLVKVGS